jgi:hypothetical protein
MVKQGTDYVVFPRKVAEGAIPFCRFVKDGTADDGVLVCGADEESIGVSEHDLRYYDLDGAVRTGYAQYEQVRTRRKGIAIVEAATAIDAKTMVKSAANGKATAYTAPSLSSPTPTYAELLTVRDAYKTCQGKAITAASAAGDFIEVDLEYRP